MAKKNKKKEPIPALCGKCGSSAVKVRTFSTLSASGRPVLEDEIRCEICNGLTTHEHL